MSNNKASKFKLKPLNIAIAGIVAALYVVLCLPFASFSFGMVQFRLAEVLTVMPAFSSMAIPGVFLGCLLSNILNPNNLGLIDIFGGSLATLIAAMATYWLAKPYRRIILAERRPDYSKIEANTWKKRFMRFVMLFPPILFNAVIVGSYLPYLLLEHTPTTLEIIGSIASIFLSQSLVIYVLGMGVVLALEKAKFPVEGKESK